VVGLYAGVFSWCLGENDTKCLVLARLKQRASTKQ